MTTNSQQHLRHISPFSTKVGVDTLQLCLSDFNIAPHNALRVASTIERPPQKGVLRWRNQTLWMVDGHEVRGACAYYVSDNLNMQLRPVRPDLVGPSFLTLFVNFSVSKRCFGNNLPPTTTQQLRSVVVDVAEFLSEVGIETDLTCAKVSRIDLFRNVTLDTPVSHYLPLLCSLNPSRFKTVRSYSTGVWMKNSQRLVRIYDKVAEMEYRGVRLNKDMANLTLLRAEYSWRNGFVA